jgi:multidrug efflux pump subunit AcrA (membrane-fusion protein)
MVPNAILIPQLAVMEEQSAKTVYIVDPGNKVALRTVVLGERYEDMFVVKDGVRPGERVITEGLQKVKPGMVVAPRKVGPALSPLS